MDATEATIRDFLAALPASGYDLGVLGERGMYRVENASHFRVLRMLPFLRNRNANGAHIYLRPTGESAYTLLDDLTPASLNRLAVEGYGPAAVVETSPGNLQAWLKHSQPFTKELGTLAARTLAAQFGADGSAADWRRFGRAPGFTNRKLQHRNEQGLYPFAHLLDHTGQSFPRAAAFHARILHLQRRIEQQRTAIRARVSGQSQRISASLTLYGFRSSPRYQGRPAAADLAFSIAAYSQRWEEQDIAAALTRDYLSRDTNQNRQAAYIRRTLAKALRWAA